MLSRRLIVLTILVGSGCGAPEQNADAATHEPDSSVVQITRVTWDSIFGVVSMRNDTICMETNSSQIPASGHFLIVLPENGQSIPGRIEGRLGSCPGREALSTSEQKYFRVSAAEFSGLGIAVLLDSVQSPTAGRTDLDRDGTLESYRTCASMEGVHLTAWSGEPLRSRRLWRYYFYVGYDLEPNCTEADTAG